LRTHDSGFAGALGKGGSEGHVALCSVPLTPCNGSLWAALVEQFKADTTSSIPWESANKGGTSKNSGTIGDCGTPLEKEEATLVHDAGGEETLVR
jgi:hypothetical protein